MNSIGFRKPRRTVVFGFDDRIARQSIPALTSLSHRGTRELEVVILARDWRPWTRAYCRSLELERLRIRLLDMSAVSLSGSLRLLAHTTAATVNGLYLPRLLPDTDRIVYLDADLICLADLEPLYELVLPDSGIAAKPSLKEGYASGRSGQDLGAPSRSRDDPRRAAPRGYTRCGCGRSMPVCW